MSLQLEWPNMALRKILQCFDLPHSASHSNSNPFIFGPYDARVLPQNVTNESRSSSDDPSCDISKLRHSIGPGLQFMSYLHWERFLDEATQQYDVSEVPRCAPYIIMAGDIGRLRDHDALIPALRQICDKFDKVLLVPGNHEFYGSSREEGLLTTRAMHQAPGDKFVMLNRTRLDLKNVVVLGCTLQSHILEGTQLTNDFAQIERWTVADHNAEHCRDLEWLEKALGEVADAGRGSRVVIVTHYAPAFEQANHPRIRHSPYRYCFSSNTLEKFKGWKGADHVSHWIFGHTHYTTTFTCGNTLVLSNQPNDSECHRKFDPEVTI
jgi:predicted phosphodiesterase